MSTLLRFTFAAPLALALAGCGPLTSIACERADVLCGNVDVVACEETMERVPPRVRSDIVGCTTNARSCQQAVDCFARNQLFLPTED